LVGSGFAFGFSDARFRYDCGGAYCKQSQSQNWPNDRMCAALGAVHG
jgi:hypothetical protein